MECSPDVMKALKDLLDRIDDGDVSAYTVEMTLRGIVLSTKILVTVTEKKILWHLA
jgi:hypothetical protein